MRPSIVSGSRTRHKFLSNDCPKSIRARILANNIIVTGNMAVHDGHRIESDGAYYTCIPLVYPISPDLFKASSDVSNLLAIDSTPTSNMENIVYSTEGRFRDSLFAGNTIETVVAHANFTIVPDRMRFTTDEANIMVIENAASNHDNMIAGTLSVKSTVNKIGS